MTVIGKNAASTDVFDLTILSMNVLEGVIRCHGVGNSDKPTAKKPPLFKKVSFIKPTLRYKPNSKWQTNNINNIY